MPSMPSFELLTSPMIPYVTYFHGASCSHRLKRLEKVTQSLIGDLIDYQVNCVSEKFPVCICWSFGKYFVQFRLENFVKRAAFEYEKLLNSFSMSMNMHCRVRTSVSEDLNSFHHQLYVNPLQFCTSRVEGNTVNEIGTALTRFLNIQDDDHKKASSFISSSKSSSLSGVENQDMCEEEPLHFDKCLTKSATFPGPVEIESPSADASLGCQNEEDVITELITNFESVNPLHSPSQSFPAPSKLVSSMKGRREKQGIPLKEKLNVTWAPDVYDPVPTSVSHLLTSKSQRQNHHHHHRSSSSKKHGKSKHKGSSGKSSRSSGKDKKKQTHRVSYGGGYVSSSSRCFNSLEEEDRGHAADDFYENGGGGGGAVDFDVGSSPDAYCGSSFLKETTITELHFSVAEAT